MYFLRYLCFQRHCMIHPNACTSTLSGILIPMINNQKFWDQYKILTHPSPNPTFCPETWNYGREGGRGRRFLRITAKSGTSFCWLLEMRIAHRGSGLEMTFNEPFVAGTNASSWRTNNPVGQENQRKNILQTQLRNTTNCKGNGYKSSA